MIENKTLVLDVENFAPKQSGSDPLVWEKQFVYVGNFQKQDPITGEILMKFSVDSEDLAHWEKTHKGMLEAGLDIPMPVGHTEDPMSRAATALEYIRKPDEKGRDSLFVKYKFKTEELAKELRQSNVSLYAPKEYSHNGKTWARPIRHIAFTDYPVIPDLGPSVIAASAEGLVTPPTKKGSSAMKLVDIAARLNIQHDPDLSEDGIGKLIISSYTAMKEELDELKKEPEKEGDDADSTKKSAEAIAASIVNKSLALENRKLKIDQLLLDRRIDAARAKELKTVWASDALTLSAESGKAFDSIIETFAKNEQIELGGKTKAQNGGGNTGSTGSVLVRGAQKRAGIKSE